MVEVLAFHLMPYMNMPKDFHEKYETSWVTFPNSYYDPELGHQYYNEYLDQLELADQLGYDGIVVNEHHQTAYGNMPSPNLMAAMLARRVKRAKLAILGNAIPLHSTPQKVAEEIAILDVVTGGNRVISGFVRGVGAEYFTFRNVNPTESKDRFYEAHDLIIKAWTEPGPFEFRGKYYNFPYVNVWPRPLTKPFPRIFLPTQGSTDTIEFGAKHRYTLLQTLSPIQYMKTAFDKYREEADKAGYTPKESQFGWSHKVYVAETDAKAWEEFEEHVTFFFEKMINMPPQMQFPPGYVGIQSLHKIMNARAHSKNRAKTMQELFDEGYITVGSEDTVRQRLTELQKEMRFGVINAHMHTGNMPNWKALKNLDLFGRYVLPHIQKLGEPLEAPEQAEPAATKG